jgi:hypothetical protein
MNSGKLGAKPLFLTVTPGPSSVKKMPPPFSAETAGLPGARLAAIPSAVWDTINRHSLRISPD